MEADEGDDTPRAATGHPGFMNSLLTPKPPFLSRLGKPSSVSRGEKHVVDAQENHDGEGSLEDMEAGWTLTTTSNLGTPPAARAVPVQEPGTPILAHETEQSERLDDETERLERLARRNRQVGMAVAKGKGQKVCWHNLAEPVPLPKEVHSGQGKGGRGFMFT